MGRNGDCLYATAIARQIKSDYPDCHLTWAISSLCRSIIENNPHVDAVWEVQQANHDQTKEVWNKFEQEVWKRKVAGEFDEVFLPQIPPNNFQNYDGTSRSSLFRGYPHPITVPVQPVIRLIKSEVESVNKFAAECNLHYSDTIILIEAASTSGQSYVTPEFAKQIALIALTKNPDLKFVLSSDKKIKTDHKNIIDGSVLTLRENVELTKYCIFIIGCSSGISWLATSDWAKPIPQIQLLRYRTRMYASMLHDAKYFGLPTENILEIVETTPHEIADIILSTIVHGFAQTRQQFQQYIPLKFDFYLSQIFNELFKIGLYQKAAQAISHAFERYHYDENGIIELKRTIHVVLTPYIRLLWYNLKENEKVAFLSLGYQPKKKFTLFYIWKSWLQLCILSFGGDYYRLARLFLLERINKFLGRTRE